ncbi:MAG: type II toxin-antitoxin system Phd/YefM family antitoxin [Candidatus Peribacteraceae bacterium]|nr:type II toxin-antitoxin system Phd/YefM family antitoxin [Candidatus Peribacteraceae bacterium]
MRTKYFTATHARKEFFKMLELASQPEMSVTITLNGIPKVVILSLEQYEGWKETLEIMSDPQLMKDIRASKKDKKAGKPILWEKEKKRLNMK